MEIRKATKADLPVILSLYERARAFMAQNGNASQWGTTNPPRSLIESDIAADGSTKGAGAFCLQWALAQCGNIRIDTHRDNRPMQGLLAKLGFSYCGTITIADGTERIAFQKQTEGRHA